MCSTVALWSSVVTVVLAAQSQLVNLGLRFWDQFLSLSVYTNFTHHASPVSFGRDTKSRWSLLAGVYARGSKRSHTGGNCVTCSGWNHAVLISVPKPRSWWLELLPTRVLGMHQLRQCRLLTNM